MQGRRCFAPVALKFNGEPPEKWSVGINSHLNNVHHSAELAPEDSSLSKPCPDYSTTIKPPSGLSQNRGPQESLVCFRFPFKLWVPTPKIAWPLCAEASSCFGGGKQRRVWMKAIGCPFWRFLSRRTSLQGAQKSMFQAVRRLFLTVGSTIDKRGFGTFWFPLLFIDRLSLPLNVPPFGFPSFPLSTSKSCHFCPMRFLSNFGGKWLRLLNLDKLQEAQLGEQGPWRPPCSCDFDSSGGAYKSEELSENDLFSHKGSHVIFCTALWFVSKVTFC